VRAGYLLDSGYRMAVGLSESKSHVWTSTSVWDFTDAILGLGCRAQGPRSSALERRCLTRLETGLAAAG